MRVINTIKLEMTDEEKKAIKTVYRMLYDLDWENEKAVAEELGDGDLDWIRDNLSNLYKLGGGCKEDL